MSKENYYNMCEQLGTDPNDGVIPIDFDDLTFQSQDALIVFQYLRDEWDHMNGIYLGKDLSNIKFIFELLDIAKDNWLVIIQLLNYIVEIRIKKINKKKR